jgi:peptidyl-prolyl cis-trans isomerase A (cyclophilin A)
VTRFPVQFNAGRATVPSNRRVLSAAVVCALAGAMAVGCSSDGCPRVTAPEPTQAQRVLLEPASDAFRAVPPDTFDVRFETSAGEFVVRINREWAPMGAYRFYNLVRNGFFEGVHFFRVIPGFMAQFGVHGVPAVNEAWLDQQIPDDPVRYPNERGTLTFATAGADTRTTQLFINYRDNSAALDPQGFAPIGRVVQGLDVVDRLYSEYGETAPEGRGPAYECMLEGGNAYLERRFERMDSIVSARIVRESSAAIDTAAVESTRSVALATLPAIPQHPAEREERDQ